MPSNVLIIGAGEYTTGYVPTTAGVASDKPAGVVALTLFDLRRRGLVDRLVLCDICGTKLPAVREALRTKVGEAYRGMDTSLECFPADDVAYDPNAYKKAIQSMHRGDLVIIFTPDDTHAEIALEAIHARLHVLLAKPAVKTLNEHLGLIDAARERGVLVAVEFHKRWDPIYSDARSRIQQLGPFSFFSSTMTQPKQQIDTFRSWAGKSSDISYYLNSHHIDIHNWALMGRSRPASVVAMASTGVGEAILDGRACEDTITLMVQWENISSTSVGTAIYTASWAAPKSDCHTQQYFHYMGHKGELRVDQAHRGYSLATDEGGHSALNPLYMRYTPDPNGYFAGQEGYGYVSIAKFIEAAELVNDGRMRPAEVSKHDHTLATIDKTVAVTAILEAGRVSLDCGGEPVRIMYRTTINDPKAGLDVPVGLERPELYEEED